MGPVGAATTGVVGGSAVAFIAFVAFVARVARVARVFCCRCCGGTTFIEVRRQ